MIRFFLLFLFSSGAFAVNEEIYEFVYEFDNPEHEARYQALTYQLRCLVCQNQNIADSNAGLAQDLRRKTYALISSGKSDDEIIDFMVKRYGEFVLYKPRLTNSTLVLWAGPFFLLLLAAFVMYKFVRRNHSTALNDQHHNDMPDDEERRAARDLLNKQ